MAPDLNAGVWGRCGRITWRSWGALAVSATADLCVLSRAHGFVLLSSGNKHVCVWNTWQRGLEMGLNRAKGVTKERCSKEKIPESI